MAFGKTAKSTRSKKFTFFYKKEKVHPHYNNCRRIQWKYPGYRFYTKTPKTLQLKTQQAHFLETPSKAIFATKNLTLPPFATTLVPARTFQTVNKEQNYLADIGVLKHPLIAGPSTWVTFDENNHCTIQLQNWAPHEISIETRDIIGIADTEDTTPIPFDDESLAATCDQIYQWLPKVKNKTWTRNEIKKRCLLRAPELYRSKYIDTLFWHQAAISMDKYDLGLAKDFTHRIHLKDDKPIFWKQFNLPKVHTQFI
jgi:hypothetical protein